VTFEVRQSNKQEFHASPCFGTTTEFCGIGRLNDKILFVRPTPQQPSQVGLKKKENVYRIRKKSWGSKDMLPFLDECAYEHFTNVTLLTS
jgi:hypothetical protein